MVRPCVAAGNSPMNKKLNQNKWIESCRNWKIMKNLWVRKPPQQHVSALQGARDAPLETEAPCFGRGDSKKHYIASQESEHKDDIDSMVPEWSQDGPRMVPGLGPPALQGETSKHQLPWGLMRWIKARSLHDHWVPAATTVAMSQWLTGGPVEWPLLLPNVARFEPCTAKLDPI